MGHSVILRRLRVDRIAVRRSGTAENRYGRRARTGGLLEPGAPWIVGNVFAERQVREQLGKGLCPTWKPGPASVTAGSMW